jgi:hypothetical protein
LTGLKKSAKGMDGWLRLAATLLEEAIREGEAIEQDPLLSSCWDALFGSISPRLLLSHPDKRVKLSEFRRYLRIAWGGD